MRLSWSILFVKSEIEYAHACSEDLRTILLEQVWMLTPVTTLSTTSGDHISDPFLRTHLYGLQVPNKKKTTAHLRTFLVVSRTLYLSHLSIGPAGPSL